MTAPARAAPYADGYAHLAAELDRLDLLLRLRVHALRRAWRGRPEPAGPLYVPDAEVDWLLAGEPAGTEPDRGGADPLLRALAAAGEAIDARVGASEEAGVFLPLVQLARRFGLSRWEVQAVVVCLAPELRRRYDRVYAWLQDDATLRRPGTDLLVELLCEDEAERWRARAFLSPQAPLRHAGLLEAVDDPQGPPVGSGLAQLLRLDPRVVQFLLGDPVMDARLEGVAQLLAPGPRGDAPEVEPGAAGALAGFAERWAAGGTRRRTVLHLHGPAGVGRRALALHVCAALGCPLLCLDARGLPAAPEDAGPLLRRALRESLLLQAPLLVEGADALLREGDGPAAVRAALGREAQAYGWLVFVAGEAPWPHADAFGGMVFHSVALPAPGVRLRERAWRRALAEALPGAADADALAPAAAARYGLTPGQIRRAADALAHRRAVEGAGGPVEFAALAAACRGAAQHGLDALATRVAPRSGWDDLVLEDDARAQLRELCDQVRHQHTVQGWGYGGRHARGAGISALFSGPPGTGKTLAAEVVAGELQLDLYRVDLARMVSKYVGETEKNLSRVFAEAEGSNAILFFDEADALFGKRTEVSDAHDRYANLETSYLLQRMEDYTGVVILASNLRDNMDEAFLRRIRFVVEFPFPDAAGRLGIWKAHVPGQAPVADDVDYALLAERVPVAGGNIRNIVLNAAFFAAADGGVLNMEHLARGTRREYEKIGKLWNGVLGPRRER